MSQWRLVEAEAEAEAEDELPCWGLAGLGLGRDVRDLELGLWLGLGL